MQQKDMSAQERIRAAAKELLAETKDADGITVRQIAKRADVGIGLINYHFGSKDSLLADLVAEEMSSMIYAFEAAQESVVSPKERLKIVLTELYDFGAEHLPLVRFMIKQNIDNGDMGSALMLVPLLREVFGPDADEMRLRVLALQILYPLQLTGIAPQSFKLYSGINIMNAQERAGFVGQLINNLL
jgi:AcrR family transcriptional regulator